MRKGVRPDQVLAILEGWQDDQTRREHLKGCLSDDGVHCDPTVEGRGPRCRQKVMSVTNDVRVELYRSFIEDCRAPSPEEIGERLGQPVEQVRASLRELRDQDVIALEPNTHEVWLVHPFCATEAPFRVISGSRSWPSICIWDALGILAVVGADGTVTTKCPDCGDDLVLRIEEGEIRGPSDCVVHFGVPASAWYEDIAFT